MEIKITTNPSARIRQKTLDFELTESKLSRTKEHEDRYETMPFGYVLGYDNKRIIGVIRLFKRKIKLGKDKILLGGVGNVRTCLEHRRQGIATKLLKSAMKVLKDIDCDVVFLCTNIKKLGPLYAQFGFTPLNRTHKATGESGKIYRSKEGMIAPIKSKRIFKEILEDKKEFDIQGQDW